MYCKVKAADVSPGIPFKTTLLSFSNDFRLHSYILLPLRYKYMLLFPTLSTIISVLPLFHQCSLPALPPHLYVSYHYLLFIPNHYLLLPQSSKEGKIVHFQSIACGNEYDSLIYYIKSRVQSFPTVHQL